MKRYILLPFVVAAIIGLNSHTVTAQNIIISGGETSVVPKTAEEKEYARFFESPDEKLSLSDQILRYKLIFAVNENYYVEKGELKTRLTEKDFVALGAKPFFYKFFIGQLDETNNLMRKGSSSEEDQEEKFKKGLKLWDANRNVTSRKITDLEKKRNSEK